MNQEEKKIVTNLILDLQKNKMFEDALKLYLDTIKKMNQDKFFPMEYEWLEILLTQETRKLIKST